MKFLTFSFQLSGFVTNCLAFGCRLVQFAFRLIWISLHPHWKSFHWKHFTAFAIAYSYYSLLLTVNRCVFTPDPPLLQLPDERLWISGFASINFSVFLWVDIVCFIYILTLYCYKARTSTDCFYSFPNYSSVLVPLRICSGLNSLSNFYIELYDF